MILAERMPLLALSKTIIVFWGRSFYLRTETHAQSLQLGVPREPSRLMRSKNNYKQEKEVLKPSTSFSSPPATAGSAAPVALRSCFSSPNNHPPPAAAAQQPCPGRRQPEDPPPLHLRPAGEPGKEDVKFLQRRAGR